MFQYLIRIIAAQVGVIAIIPYEVLAVLDDVVGKLVQDRQILRAVGPSDVGADLAFTSRKERPIREYNKVGRQPVLTVRSRPRLAVTLLDASSGGPRGVCLLLYHGRRLPHCIQYR